MHAMFQDACMLAMSLDVYGVGPPTVEASPVSSVRTSMAMSPVSSMSSTPHASNTTSREENGRGVRAGFG
jgi:hypothetical protein